MDSVLWTPYAYTMLPISIPLGPGILRGFWGKVTLPLGKDAKVIVCFLYLFPESLPGLEKGKPRLAACSHMAWQHWPWDPHSPSEPMHAGHPAAAESDSR